MADDRTPRLLDQALARRSSVWTADQARGACRLVHGEADGFAGLTVDRFAGVVLVEEHRPEAGASQIVEALIERFGAAIPVFVKERWLRDGAHCPGRQASGDPTDGRVVVVEQEMSFEINLVGSAHVGLFLDGRPARRRVQEIAGGRRVLNLFAYTGGFGVAAATGGATSTTNVDQKRSALAWARRNYQLNQLPSNTRTFLRADALQYAQRAARGSGRYDLVILDPPPRFRRPGRQGFDARGRYTDLVKRCLPLLVPSGLLLAGMSSSIDGHEQLEQSLAQAAQMTGSELRVVERLGPGLDFPASSERPTSRYLLCQVSDLD